MSAPPTARTRRAPTLRSTLLAVGVGALVYVMFVVGVLVFRIAPAAARLQQQGQMMLIDYRDSQQREAVLDSTMTDLWRLLGASRRGTPARAELESHRARLQRMEESALASAPAGLTPEAPEELRSILSNGVRDEQHLRTVMLAAIAAMELPDVSMAERMMRRADSLDTPINDALAAATTFALRDVHAREIELASAARSTIRVLAFWLLIGAVAIAFIATLLRDRLYSPLSSLDRGMARVSAGELDVSLQARHDDELGRLTDHFNRMTSVLRVRAEMEKERSERETEARTRLILESALDAVIVIDATGLVREWSPRAEAMFGWTRDEMLGRSIADRIIPEKYRHAHVSRLGAYRAGSVSRVLNRTLELVAQRRDGTLIPIELSVAPLMRGTEMEFSAFIRDITERHESQAAIARSEARYRAAFEQAAVGMAEVTRDGVFQRVNRVFAQITGRSEQELIGMSTTTVTHPDDLESDAVALQRLMRNELPFVQREKRYLRPDGSVAWAKLATAVVHDAAGAPSYVLSVVQDVTEEKRLEAELKQAQKMDAIGRLAGGIAHDFNNLLTTIMGYAELLQYEEGVSKQGRDDARSIATSARRGADLARNLLTLARRSPDRRERTDVPELVREVATLVSRTFDRRIDVTIELPPVAPVISGDRSLLHNALLNLALNARDAMPNGGRLSFAASAVTIDAEFCARHGGEAMPGEYVRIDVRDTGEGMSASTRERIFEPFFSTKEPGKGTGLGLAMVYGTVRSHGGMIEVDSVPDEGTTFHLYLPLGSEIEYGPEDGADRLITGRGRVLVVDDEQAVRHVVSRMVEHLGYEVETANDGLEAVARVEHGDPALDIVILDGNMPRLSGHEAARRIRALRPDLPLVLASGYMEPDAGGESWRADFAGTVPKPYDLATLSAVIAEHLAPRG